MNIYHSIHPKQGRPIPPWSEDTGHPGPRSVKKEKGVDTMPTHPSTAAIILAAGSSSRMQAGRHKLLLPLADRPVLVHVLTTVLASQARPIIVVLGHHATQVRSALAAYLPDADLLLLENPDYQQGMSTSLRVGIDALVKQNASANPGNSSHQRVDSAMILLADQPLITSHIVDTLIGTYRATKKPVVAPLYNGKRGNPVLFSAALFPELLAVTGDEGGRTVIQQHHEDIASVELGDVQANYDIDTWDAYQQVVIAWERRKL